MEIVRHNEEIARKFFEIEKRILTILNFTDLFEVLLTEIRSQFSIPYTWISLIDTSDLSGFIQELEGSEALKPFLNVIDSESFNTLVGERSSPLLVNHNLKPYFRLLPKNRKYFVKSMAIAPISLDGQLIGSLNQADITAKRFQPGIDTSLLEQLAVKVSLCLSNVTAHERLRYLAYHDPLTGLLNRRVMESVLEREYFRYQRYLKSLSVVFVDLDHFKHVNDAHGHDRGDDLLKYVARVLMELSRNTDVVARYAGDEFVMILPETDRENAGRLMERIRHHFERNPLCAMGVTIPVSISYGIATADDGKIKDPRALIKQADEALYEVKQRRNSMPLEKPTIHSVDASSEKIIDLSRERTEK
jgi:diguanylate cyclase (GGDEF)-like protein